MALRSFLQSTNQEGKRTRVTGAPTRRMWRPLIASAILFGLTASTASRADLFGLGLFSPKGDTYSEQRDTIQRESADMLEKLYAAKPELRAKIAKAPGYATFKKTDIKLLLVASGNGYGVLVNNQTGQKTYMRVASLDGGIGAGVDDLRVIFVFNEASVMQTFVSQGWQFGGSADATGKYQDVGGSASQSVKANVNFKDGAVDSGSSSNVAGGAGAGKTAGANIASGGPMQIYQFTESGISLQATVSGTKYWKDSDLNN